MQTLMIVTTAVAIAAFSLALYRYVEARTWARHAPVEYFSSWDGYAHPISVHHPISKEEVDKREAKGEVYLMGHFDADNRLVRVIKMYKGAVFFDFVYSYYPTGTRKTARITNNKGVTTEREYDTWGRGTDRSFW